MRCSVYKNEKFVVDTILDLLPVQAHQALGYTFGSVEEVRI